MVKDYIMAVTPDEYELPLSPPMSLSDLSRFLKVDRACISRAVRDQNVKRRKRKYVFVELDEE